MELLEQIEAYLEQSGVPPSTFGRMAVGDPRLVTDLRSGRRVRRSTEERLRRYLNHAASKVPFVDTGQALLH
jgi:hypothetical protein